MYDVWVDVSKNALINNYKSIRNYVSDKVKICCVIKANAYSHDLVQTAKIFEAEGCDYFGVTHIDEAIVIREAGINIPILLFMPVSVSRLEEAINYNFDLTVASIFDAENINEIATKLDKVVNIHIKIDTGMGRLGVLQANVFDLFDVVGKLKTLKIIGTYTHFTHSGDINLKYTNKQFNQFKNITNSLKRRHINCGMLHCSNSSAIARFPNMHLDMVRCGTMLFGQFPSIYAKNSSIRLENTWNLKARVVAIRHLPPGTTIGYGSEYTVHKDITAAVVSVGFAHGFTLIPESLIYRIEILRYLIKKYTHKYTVTICDTKCPIIGRIGMQMSVVDISEIKDKVKVDDEVCVPCMRLPVDSGIPRVFK